MDRELKLTLPEETFAALLRVAAMAGKPVERWAADYLAEEVRSIDEDPLLGLSGSVTGGMPDVSDRHDHYLGAAAMEGARGASDS